MARAVKPKGNLCLRRGNLRLNQRVNEGAEDHVQDEKPMGLNALFRLDGRRALVTGSTAGIGLAIADLFRAAGAEVVTSGLEATKDAIVADLSSKSAATDLIDKAQAKLGGPIDILVSNAGMEGPVGPMGAASEEALRRVFDVNLMSAYWLAAGVAPGMAEAGGGAMIFTASIAGLRGNGAIGPYGMTKAALMQLVRNLAVEHGPKNIRANAIAPGLIETGFSDKLTGNEDFMTRRLAATPLRRMGQASEIASAALWLASPGGAFTTGQTIVIDGGTLISDGS